MAKKRKALTPAGKKIILLNYSIAAILLFFVLPANHEWLNEKIFDPLGDVNSERKNLDLGHRMQYRFDSMYTYPKQIEHFLHRKGAKNALVLLPPTAYFKEHNIDFHVPEPVVFYYFTGVKTLWANCANAEDANWYVSVRNGIIMLDSVTSKQALHDTIASFTKYKISL